MKPINTFWIILSFGYTSCVSTGTYKALQVEKSKDDSLYAWAMATLKTSKGDNARLMTEKAALKDSMNDLSLQTSALKQNNAVLHQQLTDLSAISTAQAESIRKSIDNIGAKDAYLQRLRTALSRRDSANLAVLMEIKAAMGSFNDSLVSIAVARGVVSVTVADRLLFGDDSSNYMVTDKGKTVLVRMARVLKDQPDIHCRVEVCPDSMTVAQLAAWMPGGPVDTAGLVARLGATGGAGGATDSVGMDSWALDVRRAASVVRTLQNQYRVEAEQLTAAGRGEPGRGTIFILAPPGDELSKVLEKK